MKTTETFRVWIRPLGQSCRVRVDGIENGRWLINRLNSSTQIEITEPNCQNNILGCFTFLIAFDLLMTPLILNKLLRNIPEVYIMCRAE